MSTYINRLKASLGVERITPTSLLAEVRVKFRGDSLFRNSVYLILSTGVQASFGFVFWILAARLYSSNDIGIATALISVTMLVTSLSLLGFNSSFVRFLPKHSNRNDVINTGIITVALASLVISGCYMLGITRFSPKLQFISSHHIYTLLFIVFTAVESVNTLTDSIFIAYRASRYNFIVYSFFSIAKVISLVSLVALGSYGVFFSYIGAVIVAFIFSLYFLMRRFGYKPQPVIKVSVLKRVATFSSANYVATFATALPAQLFPIMIINYIGS